jgi:hypothetical protein
MKTVFIETVGFAAPGLPTWQAARATLRGESIFVPAPLPPHTPAMLPLNERRRATPAIRMAFRAAEDAMQGTTLSAASLATVFASSEADAVIIHRICLALTATPRLISPTDFHNSVHNAAAGYWSIAAGARAASTSICAYDGSFAAGLFEACSQVLVDGRDVLLVAFDLSEPLPMLARRAITGSAAAALVLTREPTERSMAALTCRASAEAETTLDESALELMRLGNPAARALPLIQSLALQRPGPVFLPMGSGANLAAELRAP